MQFGPGASGRPRRRRHGAAGAGLEGLAGSKLRAAVRRSCLATSSRCRPMHLTSNCRRRQFLDALARTPARSPHARDNTPWCRVQRSRRAASRAWMVGGNRGAPRPAASHRRAARRPASTSMASISSMNNGLPRPRSVMRCRLGVQGPSANQASTSRRLSASQRLQQDRAALDLPSPQLGWRSSSSSTAEQSTRMGASRVHGGEVLHQLKQGRLRPVNIIQDQHHELLGRGPRAADAPPRRLPGPVPGVLRGRSAAQFARPRARPLDPHRSSVLSLAVASAGPSPSTTPAAWRPLRLPARR